MRGFFALLRACVCVRVFALRVFVCACAPVCEWERVKIEDGFAGLQLITAGPPGSPYHALTVTHAGHSGSCATAPRQRCALKD